MLRTMVSWRGLAVTLAVLGLLIGSKAASGSDQGLLRNGGDLERCARPPRPASSAEGVPPQGIGSLLSVLSRAQTPDDVLPPGTASSIFRVVFPADTRFLGATIQGDRYYIAVGRTNVVRFSPGCLRRLAKSTRARLTRELQEERQATRRAHLLLVASRANGSVEGSVVDATRLRQGLILGIAQAPGRVADTVVGVVPDGVAAVQVQWRTGGSAISPASDNFFLATFPPASTGPSDLTRVTWLDASGSVLKDIDLLTLFGPSMYRCTGLKVGAPGRRGRRSLKSFRLSSQVFSAVCV